MSGDIDRLFLPLKYVDVAAIQQLADKLKKSRNKQEQDIGSFLSRVVVFREEGTSTEPKENHIARNHGLRDLSD